MDREGKKGLVGLCFLLTCPRGKGLHRNIFLLSFRFFNLILSFVKRPPDSFTRGLTASYSSIFRRSFLHRSIKQ